MSAAIQNIFILSYVCNSFKKWKTSKKIWVKKVWRIGAHDHKHTWHKILWDGPQNFCFMSSKVIL